MILELGIARRNALRYLSWRWFSSMLEKVSGSHRLRCSATLLTLLLLIAQSFATAHYHQKDFRDNFTQSVQGNDALCSLCLFHFHAPANQGAPSAEAAPAVAVWRLTPQAVAHLHTPAVALLFSRAPPIPL
jgi:hypothetical protein